MNKNANPFIMTETIILWMFLNTRILFKMLTRERFKFFFNPLPSFLPPSILLFTAIPSHFYISLYPLIGPNSIWAKGAAKKKGGMLNELQLQPNQLKWTMQFEHVVLKISWLCLLDIIKQQQQRLQWESGKVRGK